ncbi:hypothetical protein [Clostridium sp. YIM B02500]|nr:hypothetical protein [Clostridium sp. YIM B02500]
MRNLDLLKFLSLEEFSKIIYEMANKFETEEQFKIWLQLENGIDIKEEEE